MELRPMLSTLRRHKVTALLLVLEIALSCAIICNAAFMIHLQLQVIDLPSGVAEHELVQIKLGTIGAGRDGKARTETNVAALRQIAGVTQVALTRYLPFTLDGASSAGISLHPWQPHRTLEAETYFGQNLLPTLGVRLVEGRDFRPDEYVDFDAVVAALNRGDQTSLPHVMIITRVLAQRLWPGQDALGRTIYVGHGIPFRVIGVVAHLAEPIIRRGDSEYSTIWPLRMTASDGASYVIRCASPNDRKAVLKAAVARLRQLNPNHVVLMQRTYDEARRAFFARDRSMIGILAGVIVALLVVTSLGIAGLASFWVAQRRRMIGVRRALGATRADILRYFQTENFLLATMGIALGMVLAYGINLYLMSHYELRRLPAIYLSVGAVTLWVIGQLAVLAPALRAAALPPIAAIRGSQRMRQ